MADHKILKPFIWKWEGRISADKGDTLAAKDRCYGRFEYIDDKGKKRIIDNPHTSRGIMWSTFKALSEDLGYEIDKELFVEMPEWLWFKIYKNKFWDSYDLDSLPFQKIAHVMVSWKWGGVSAKEYEYLAKKLGKSGQFNGPKTFRSWVMKNQKTLDENQVVAAACDVREDFFRTRSYPSARETNLTGWLNRLNDFRKFNSVSSFASRGAGIFVLLLGVGLYCWLK